MELVTPDPLDAILRLIEPDVRWTQDTAQVDVLLAALATDVMNSHPRRVDHVTRRRRRLLLAPALVGTLALTAAAGYGMFETSSAAFGQAVSRYVQMTPLPPGTDTEAYVAEFSDQGLRFRGSMSDRAVQSSVAYYGVCAWLTAWERRDAAGDAVGAADAVAAIRRAIAVEALAATDGGGVIDNLRRRADDASRGDRASVQQELANNCTGLPLAGVQ